MELQWIVRCVAICTVVSIVRSVTNSLQEISDASFADVTSESLMGPEEKEAIDDITFSADDDIQDLGLVFEDLNERICDLNSQIQLARTALSSTVTSLNQIMHSDHCDVEFEGRCFHIAIGDRLQFYEAKLYCKKMGWVLGTIYSTKLLFQLERYSREIFPHEKQTIAIWIAQTATQANDLELLLETEEYIDSNPSITQAINEDLLFAIRIFTANHGQTVIAKHPGSYELDGALCEL